MVKIRKFKYGPSLVECERDEGIASSPLCGLFTATQRRLLGLLFGEPGRAFFVQELMQLTGAGAGATHRELHRLRCAGLVKSWPVGPRLFVQADPGSPIHIELANLIRKTVGLVGPLREACASLRGALVFAIDPLPSWLGSDASEIALVVIHEHRASAHAAAGFGCELAAQRLHRFVFPMHFAPAELRRPDERLARVLRAPRTWVFGDEQRLRAMTSGP